MTGYGAAFLAVGRRDATEPDAREKFALAFRQRLHVDIHRLIDEPPDRRAREAAQRVEGGFGLVGQTDHHLRILAHFLAVQSDRPAPARSRWFFRRHRQLQLLQETVPAERTPAEQWMSM